MPVVRANNSGPIEIYYEAAGAGEPLVLIGGLTSTAEIWGLQVPALSEHYRVITPDNRGSGRTRVPNDDGVRTAERFAGDVAALLDGLDLERVHLLGASMGGMIVQAFAVAHPERLATLTIACSSPGGPQSVAIDPTALRDLLDGSSALDAGGADSELTGYLRAVAHPRTLSERRDALELYLKGKREHPHSDDEIARRQRDLRSFDYYGALPQLRVPTLILTGADDRLVPPANSRILAERIPGAELVEIPESGHIFFLEQADLVNRALLDFLSRHAGRTA